MDGRRTGKGGNVGEAGVQRIRRRWVRSIGLEIEGEMGKSQMYRNRGGGGVMKRKGIDSEAGIQWECKEWIICKAGAQWESGKWENAGAHRDSEKSKRISN